MRAVSAKETVAFLNVIQRQEGHILAADALVAQQAYKIEENQKDIMLARKNKMTEPLIDRLLLNENRIRKMAEGLREIAALPDILGEIISMKTRPNGLRIGEKRVPLGVVGIIYEARPNVTADAFGLCFKTGNVAVLKGGSAAANSCRAIAEVIRGALAKKGMEPEAQNLVEDTSRESAMEMLRMKDYLDVLIVMNDTVAFAAYKAASELRKDIPADLKLISYGNYNWSSFPTIGLTTFEQHFFKYGKEAVKLLLKRMSGTSSMIQQRRIIKYDLQRRKSF